MIIVLFICVLINREGSFQASAFCLLELELSALCQLCMPVQTPVNPGESLRSANKPGSRKHSAVLNFESVLSAGTSVPVEFAVYSPLAWHVDVCSPMK